MKVRPGSLPLKQTSFVGRREVLVAVHDVFSKSHLVTLTGFGGMGKSRLALTAAEDRHGGFPDGVWFIDLVPAHPDVLSETVLSAIDGQDHSVGSAHEHLLAYLRDRELLLVLDNCEHILDAVTKLVAEILAVAPRVRILATSRESLDCAGERVVAVPPLSTPPPQVRLSIDDIDRFESVTLLLDRAAAVNPRFIATPENIESIAELCRRLEGSPLAIEMAASRLRSMSVDQILRRLDEQLEILTRGDRVAPARQRSLRALVDWSHELCTEAERLMWHRAAVFVGGFDLEAAEGVCADEVVRAESVADLLDQLVSKSILVAEPHGRSVRFSFLETLRQYGFERLVEGGESEMLLRRHRDYYTLFAEEALRLWPTEQQAAVISRLRTDQFNLVRALEWSFATPGEARTGVHLAVSLRFHWAAGGFLRQGRRWLDAALRASDDSVTEIGTVLWVAAWVALCQGDREAADRYLDQADVTAARRSDHDLGAYVGLMRGSAALIRSDLPLAIQQLGDAADALAARGDIACALLGGMQQVLALAQSGNSADARAVGERSIALSRSCGEQWGRCQTEWALAFDRWLSGSFEEARDLLRQALMMKPEFNKVGTVLYMDLLAWIACSMHEDERAVRLLGVSSAMWDNLGSTVWAFGDHLGRHAEACVRELGSRLDADRFAGLLAEGARWNLADAVDYALDRTTATPAGGGIGKTASTLTKRELQVASMVADGMSNKEIASALVLSPRTIDGHLERIFGKLDFNTRSQVAVWFATSGTRPVGQVS